MCKLTNNFAQAAGGAGKATDVHPKNSSILLGSESSSSRFKPLSKENENMNKVSVFSHAAGAAKKNTCLDQKGSSVSLGCESSSIRFTPLPGLSKGVGQPAGAAKRKKPAHFIEIDQPGILLGTEGSKSRFSADSDVDKKSANPLFIGVAAGGAKHAASVDQRGTNINLGSERNGASRFSHKTRSAAGVPEKLKAGSAGEISAYGATKDDRKPTVRLSKNANTGSYSFSGGVVGEIKPRELKAHTSSMSFAGGTFAGAEENSKSELRETRPTPKFHASSIAPDDGVLAGPAIEVRKQKQHAKGGPTEHASSKGLLSGGGSRRSLINNTARTKKKVIATEHASSLCLGTDSSRYASSSESALSSARGALQQQQQQQHAPAGTRTKSLAVSDLLTSAARQPAAPASASAPAQAGRARARASSQNYGTSQIFC
jgi:hypothetical protein